MKRKEFFSDRGTAALYAATRYRPGEVIQTMEGWFVEWDDGEPEPEPASSFDRIVSRNGGEPMDHRGDALVYSQFDTAKHTVEAPAEIVQRHRVVTISESHAPDSDADAFTVGLRSLSKPYNTSEPRFFAMPKEQAQLFKVGSEIEVVLRPVPLA